jgi:hypothetical protein
LFVFLRRLVYHMLPFSQCQRGNVVLVGFSDHNIDNKSKIDLMPLLNTILWGG